VLIEHKFPEWPLAQAAGARKILHMTPNRYEDDDDWVGTPPEGRYTRDRAQPGFWAGQRPLIVGLTFTGIAVLAIVVIVLAS
jgi:hypothetical protein